ncbi:hypothetical protein JW835_08010 [bacterium]|nr:hypothetical protein [bacterium]
MKDVFYDVKLRKKVEAEVTEKVKYGDPGKERYALRAKTSDGRNLTKFVKKADWEKAAV